MTSHRIRKAAGTSSARQKVAPRVFGMISEKYRIARVRNTAISVSHCAPNTVRACAPTPKAPMVWAKVFRIRIAASDSSSPFLTALTMPPTRGLSDCSVWT